MMTRHAPTDYRSKRHDLTASLCALDQRIKVAAREGREEDAADLNDRYLSTVIARETLDAQHGRRSRRRAA